MCTTHVNLGDDVILQLTKDYTQKIDDLQDLLQRQQTDHKGQIDILQGQQEAYKDQIYTLQDQEKDYKDQIATLQDKLTHGKTMASGSALNCIPRFTGDTDCRTFLTRFKAVADAQKWEDATKIGYFTALLGDTPCHWFQSLTPDDKSTFANLSTAFLLRYDNTEYLRKKAFNDCQQTASQPIMDYIEQVQTLGRKCEKDDKAIFERIMVGLHPAVAEHFVSKEPKDLPALLKIARLQTNFKPAATINDVSAILADFRKELKSDLATMWDNVQHHVQSLSVPPPAQHQMPRETQRPRPILSSTASQGQLRQNNRAAARADSPRRVHFQQQQGKYQSASPQVNRCTRCFSRAHESSRCPFKNQQCYRCFRFGHTQITCGLQR